MMLRADQNHPHDDHDDGDDNGCPSLIDLAAFAENLRLADTGDEPAEERTDQIAAHVVGCARCLDLLANLSEDVASMQDESRLLLVPTPVVQAAMNLRLSDAPATRGVQPVRIVPSWLIFARRGLAAAASVGIAFAGYRVGQSFTAAPIESNATPSVALASNQDITFGLLDTNSTSTDGGETDLFALAFANETKEATP